MNKGKKKNGGIGGFSVIDLVILLLAVVCVVTALFREPIRRFLGESTAVEVEYTFVIRDVTDETISRPQVGETITLLESSLPIGEILSLEEKPREYVNEEEGTITISTLTCRAQVSVTEKESGYFAGEVEIKPGVKLSAKTETASFQMTIVMLKSISE